LFSPLDHDVQVIQKENTLARNCDALLFRFLERLVVRQGVTFNCSLELVDPGIRLRQQIGSVAKFA
jgi:hypothetical protein